MYNEGKVTDEDFSAVFGIEGFETIPETGEDLMTTARAEIETQRDFFNARMTQCSAEEYDLVFGRMCIMPQLGVVYVSIFDSQDIVDRMTKSVDIVDNWYADPSIENLEAAEQMFFFGDLTDGEIAILGYYMLYHINRPEQIKVGKDFYTDTFDYLDARGFLEFTDDALATLAKQNGYKK